MPAPVDVGLDAVRLPPDVFQVLHTEAFEPDRYLSATTRARVRGDGAALLVRPVRWNHGAEIIARGSRTLLPRGGPSPALAGYHEALREFRISHCLLDKVT